MAFNLTRMTAYALISAIEVDLRSIIKSHMGDIDETSELINSDLVARAKYRFEKDVGIDFGILEIKDLVEYFDLGDTYKTINSNSSKFPEHISKIIKDFTSRFERIVPIRNRVMHIRPLNYEDLPTVSAFCEDLINAEESLWVSINSTIEKLKADPSFVLALEIKSFDDLTGISHNLPIPDFDETGLIGRSEDVEKVKKLCSGSFPVISIVGEGGVGKTALALKVAYELLEDKGLSFDAIVWVSSKTTQITVNEIKDINGAIRDSLGVIQEISSQVVGDSTASLSEITEYLSAFKILLFIDNLETILDDNIRYFVESLPLGSKIIITSRIGLGAYEYPIKLQGIDESHASQLLRTVSNLRGVESLAKLDEKILRGYVNRMHRNPSYIKWFVSGVQTGLSPESILQNSGLFLEFCMSNVYEFLSKDAKLLTDALQSAPGLKDIPELAYLTGFDSLRVQKSIQELMSTNMLSQASKIKGASVKTTYQLSELARSYLGKHHKPSVAFQNSIRDKRNKINSMFEQELSFKSHNKYISSNVKIRDKSDRIIAKNLIDAIKLIKADRNKDAYELLQEAHRLSPDYFEVARVLAFYNQKNGNLSDARENYELAITLEPNQSQLHFWYGTYLLKVEDSVDEALGHFEQAFKLDQASVDVCLALAKCYMYKHMFSKSNEIIEHMKPLVETADDLNGKMYYEARRDQYYRIADDMVVRGEFGDAIGSFFKMMEEFDNFPWKYKDEYVRKKLFKCHLSLNKILRETQDIDIIEGVQKIKTWLAAEAIN